MVHKHCCYGTCVSDSRHSDRDCMKHVFFIAFPKPARNRLKCQRWVRACSREGFTVSNVNKYTYICSLHFIGGQGPTQEHPDPVPANYMVAEAERFAKRRRSPKDRSLPAQKAKRSRISVSSSAKVCEDVDEPCSSSKNDNNRSINCVEGKVSQSTQTVSTGNLRVAALSVENKCLRAKVKRLEDALNSKSKQEKVPEKIQFKTRYFTFDTLKKNSSLFKFYTGLTTISFMCLWRFLCPAALKLTLWKFPRAHSKKSPLKHDRRQRKGKLKPIDQLLLTLIRLRLALLHRDLAYRFHISPTSVSRIITTWIQFLYKKFSGLKRQMFPPREVISKHLPKSFRKIKNIRVIIDCTEIFVEQPRNFAKQGNLYSAYKNHTTYKILIGVAPNGAVMFVSECFEGSISDREIVLRSGFLEHIKKGDLILADRGFLIKDLLMKKGAFINIPPFLGKRDRFTPQEEQITRNIAKNRIHVERAIERFKKFKILKNTIPLSLEGIMSQVTFVIGCLVNFQKPIVK